MSNVIPFRQKNNTLESLTRVFAAAVYRCHHHDYEDSYRLTETLGGNTTCRDIPPSEYIVLLTDWYFIEPLTEQADDYEAAAADALTRAVDSGRLTPAGEALYQSILSVSRDMSAPEGGADDEIH